jgi:hypothetical protein
MLALILGSTRVEADCESKTLSRRRFEGPVVIIYLSGRHERCRMVGEVGGGQGGWRGMLTIGQLKGCGDVGRFGKQPIML